eukprot:TRINITY_DN65924_c0_g1_i1.p1 TRINITY_DN65924_c0_g1~~TRINITY_DN65924_c0_g1_i1.p1  ORF type:complete len:650 (+),score=103.95 TRINITY_DN65924_c0_g1_i1:45-1994(+)
MGSGASKYKEESKGESEGESSSKDETDAKPKKKPKKKAKAKAKKKAKAKAEGGRCDEKCSIMAIVKRYNCPLVFCSLPEYGADPHGHFEGGYTAPVMSIAEVLPNVISMNVYGRKLARVLNLVDFAGSTSGIFCSTRVRALTSKRTIIDEDSGRIKLIEEGQPHMLRGAGDFDISYIPLMEGRKCSPQEAKELKIENSFWICFWRGKVAGGITSTLAAMDPFMDSLRFQLLDQWAKQNDEESDSDDSFDAERAKADEEEDLANAAAIPRLNDSTKLGNGHRTVCLISVDGGPITQVEKRHLADIGKSVVSDIRRRKNDWADEVQIIWCHFPSIMDLLASMSGCKNLVVDEDESRMIQRDQRGNSTTYAGLNYMDVGWSWSQLDSWAPNYRDRLLAKPIAEILAEAAKGPLLQNLVACTEKEDVDGIWFILKQDPSLMNQIFDGDLSDVGIDLKCKVTPVTIAAMMGHHDALQALIELGADVKLKGPDDDAFDAVYGACLGLAKRFCLPDRAERCVKLLLLEGLAVAETAKEHLTSAVDELKERGFDEKYKHLPSIEEFEAHIQRVRCFAESLETVVTPNDRVLYKARRMDDDLKSNLNKEKLLKVMMSIQPEEGSRSEEELAALVDQACPTDDASIDLEEFLKQFYARP